LDIWGAVSHQLGRGANVEELRGEIVRTASKGVPIGEEANRVDVFSVRSEALSGLVGPSVPEFDARVTGSGEEEVLVRRADAKVHDFSSVFFKLRNELPSLSVPSRTTVIPRSRNNLLVVHKTTATNETSVSSELSDGPRWWVFSFDVVNVASIVETSTGHKVSRRGVGAGHHPRALQGDHFELVSCEGVPNEEFTVL